MSSQNLRKAGQSAEIDKNRSKESVVGVLWRKHLISNQKTWVLVLICLVLAELFSESLILSKPQFPHTSNGNKLVSSYHMVLTRIKLSNGYVNFQQRVQCAVKLDKCSVSIFKLEQNKSLNKWSVHVFLTWIMLKYTSHKVFPSLFKTIIMRTANV